MDEDTRTIEISTAEYAALIAVQEQVDIIKRYIDRAEYIDKEILGAILDCSVNSMIEELGGAD